MKRLTRMMAWVSLGLSLVGMAACAGEIGSAPPKGAVALFSGKEEELRSQWLQGGKSAEWKIQDGAMVSGGGSIVSKQEFKDFYLHLEFKVPLVPNAKGQARGNSGVGLQGRYEIQILDSYGIADPGRGDCGALYSQAAPLVNACKPPREWQTFDIVFRAPRYGQDGKKTENARVTVFQNGILIQNNQEATKGTGIGREPDTETPGPIILQDHGNPVEFRNIWIVPLPAQGAARY